MKVETLLVELSAVHTDYFGYITYVFKYLDQYDVDNHKCKMMCCTRYPNWQSRDLKIGDVGYVDIEVVIAGKDTWFDGEKQVPYKNNAKRFIRFIDKPSENSNEYSL